MSRRIPTHEAADYLGIAAVTLKRLYTIGEGPPRIKIGRRVIFDTADLDDYMNARKGIAPKPKVARAARTRSRPGKPKRQVVSGLTQPPQAEG
jgi:predicted DNA-binding transcriptional regulator AlpA